MTKKTPSFASSTSGGVSDRVSGGRRGLWQVLGVCFAELLVLLLVLHHRQPTFQDLTYQRNKISVMRAQALIRDGILQRLQLEHQELEREIATTIASSSASVSVPVKRQHSVHKENHALQYYRQHDHHPEHPLWQQEQKKQLQLQESNVYPAGTAVMFMNDSPKWFQRRYSSVVQNILSNIPDSWTLQIFHYNSSQFHKGIQLSHGLRRAMHMTNSRINLVAIPKSIKKKTKNKHMLFLPWVWENIPTEMVLLVGGNHVLCSNSPHTLSTFFSMSLDSSDQPILSNSPGGNHAKVERGDRVSFDYIGAPWRSKKGRGGGGGVSLRNATTILTILHKMLAATSSTNGKGQSGDQPRGPVHLQWGEEDLFFVTHMLHANHESEKRGHIPPFRLATAEITRMFSSSKDVADGASFSVSGPLPLISFDRRETVLTRSCPELKLLLPSLHEPACFGEFLSPGDVNKCRESICCLNNTKKKSC